MRQGALPPAPPAKGSSTLWTPLVWAVGEVKAGRPLAAEGGSAGQHGLGDAGRVLVPRPGPAGLDL